MPEPILPTTSTSESDLTTTLQEQRSNYDCLPCRVMGSTAFLGLGIYTYASGMKQLQQTATAQRIAQSGSRFGVPARKAALVVTSATLAALGMYRLVD